MMYETLWSLHTMKNREAYRDIFSHIGRFGMCLFFCTCRRYTGCTVLSLSCNTRCRTPATYAPVRLEPRWGTCLECSLLSFRFLHVLAYKINITLRSVSQGAKITVILTRHPGMSWGTKLACSGLCWKSNQTFSAFGTSKHSVYLF